MAEESFNAEEIAETNEEALATLARLARRYYTELVVAGFSDEEAFELVESWQRSVLDND